MPDSDMPGTWSPTPDDVAASNIGQLMKAKGFSSFADLHRWSVEDSNAFWHGLDVEIGIDN